MIEMLPPFAKTVRVGHSQNPRGKSTGKVGHPPPEKSSRSDSIGGAPAEVGIEATGSIISVLDSYPEIL
jgi:hypothetical protein